MSHVKYVSKTNPTFFSIQKCKLDISKIYPQPAHCISIGNFLGFLELGCRNWASCTLPLNMPINEFDIHLVCRMHRDLEILMINKVIKKSNDNKAI